MSDEMESTTQGTDTPLATEGGDDSATATATPEAEQSGSEPQPQAWWQKEKIADSEESALKRIGDWRTYALQSAQRESALRELYEKRLSEFTKQPAPTGKKMSFEELLTTKHKGNLDLALKEYMESEVLNPFATKWEGQLTAGRIEQELGQLSARGILPEYKPGSDFQLSTQTLFNVAGEDIPGFKEHPQAKFYAALMALGYQAMQANEKKATEQLSRANKVATTGRNMPPATEKLPADMNTAEVEARIAKIKGLA